MVPVAQHLHLKNCLWAQFFKPFANNMVALQEADGLEAKSMELVFSGGQNGAPQAMWEDDRNRNKLQGFLDGGNVELFAMTYEPTYPTEEGYHNWIQYALESNPDVTFVLALPWNDFPESRITMMQKTMLILGTKHTILHG